MKEFRRICLSVLLPSISFAMEKGSLVGTQNWTHVELEVFPDITDLEDDGGTSVVIFANPPLNYTAVVEGCWFKTHQRITIILVDGVWRHGRGRRPMKPYSKYNITVYSGTKPVAFKQFITDVGRPETGVIVEVDSVSLTSAIIYAKPRSKELLNGRPTGYRVELCPTIIHDPITNSTECVRIECKIMPCVLYKLKPGMHYNGSVWAYNTNFCMEDLENRSYQTVFKLYTKKNFSHRWILKAWTATIVIPIATFIGLSAFIIASKVRSDTYEPLWYENPVAGPILQ
ncbi:uncharacterized protein LOC111249242 isoform X1 [Varroa destructor]|uniref:Fibronectin type-III domain-containing protein n=1 Tax=Varroa destructor TaxID=109461 RepID=A0A7M7K0N3_VARDE|nr:uncharacterized protein LOC111249242 isoform X1 [Varroa destructor]XP_022658576.1 uncharacterized protein LOC111249242 isoform X1 [Varroa destructor]